MVDDKQKMIFSVKLKDSEFKQLSKLIFEEYGIKMPLAKKIMLQSRLQKRLRALEMTSFGDYCDYLFSTEGLQAEVIHMIDVVSTNKTDFFREPVHFDYLNEVVLPFYAENYASQKTINIWSAGSSSGEEAYTIAITMEEFIAKYKNFSYQINGTDISTIVLNKAASAIYPEEKTEVIPLSIKRKYFLRSKDKESPRVRVIKDIRRKVNFSRLNLMDNSYNMPTNFNIVFCRNTLIYFEREVQEKVISKLCHHLEPGGFFFIGHSESLTGFNVPLKQIKPTIFQKI
jgi:chemotaxis protein methyltransferase CheR